MYQGGLDLLPIFLFVSSYRSKNKVKSRRTRIIIIKLWLLHISDWQNLFPFAKKELFALVCLSLVFSFPLCIYVSVCVCLLFMYEGSVLQHGVPPSENGSILYYYSSFHSMANSSLSLPLSISSNFALLLTHTHTHTQTVEINQMEHQVFFKSIL